MTKFWGFTKIITSYTKLPQAVKFVSVFSLHNRKILLCQQFMVRNVFGQWRGVRVFIKKTCIVKGPPLKKLNLIDVYFERYIETKERYQ